MAVDNFIVPLNLTATLTLDETDTLTVSAVGSIVVASADAVVWNLAPATTPPPGVVIVNDGLIQSTTDRAIDTTGSPSGAARSFTLTNNGTVTSQEDAIRINNALSGGAIKVDNFGSITTSGLDSDSGQAIDFGAVTAATSIIITNRATGLIQSIDNDAIRPGTNAVVHNYGRIVAVSEDDPDDSSDGVNFDENAGSTLNNYATGTVIGGRHGVTGEAVSTIVNYGEITGQRGSGINIDADFPTGALLATITNYGTISGTSEGDQDGDGVDIDDVVDLDNYGTINAFGTPDAGLSEAITVGGGTINNFAGGVIFSVGRGINVDNSDDGAAFAATQIYNEGTIQSAGEAIRIIGSFADAVTNKGTIIGSVHMGTGNDQVNLYTGSTLQGALEGGDGELDFLNLLMDEDALESTGTLSAVSGFEILAVGAGSWTITDTQVYGAGVEIVLGAELVLGQGFAAGELGGSIVNYGSFAINRGDTFTLLNAISGDGRLEQRGEGTTIIAQANTYAGGTLLTAGILELSAVGAAGTGAVTFDYDGGETLRLADAALTDNAFANTVMALGEDDAVDFGGLAFIGGTRVSYDDATGLVTVIGREETYTFTLQGAESTALAVVSDGNGGTSVILKEVGRDIQGTWKNDVVNGQKTVLGQPLPTDADDTIAGKRGDDKIAGLAGSDELKGDGGDDALFGSDGDDWLYGGTGANKLSGGAGFNAFVFDTKLGEGKAGKGTGETFSFAKIKGFTIGADQVLLDSKIFKALEPGALSPDAFAIGKKAKSDDVHILYQNGNIRYDEDGKGGKDAVLFAQVGKGLAIDAGDFLVI